jgi:hypothetical protein
MPSEYTTNDIRDVNWKFEHLQQGAAALRWILEATAESDLDCVISMLWLSSIITEALDEIGPHVPRCPAAPPPAYEEIGDRDGCGPFADLAFATDSGFDIAKLLGKKARHLRFVFEEPQLRSAAFLSASSAASFRYATTRKTPLTGPKMRASTHSKSGSRILQTG